MRTLAIAAAVLSLVLSGCGWQQSARYTRTDTATEASVANAPLNVEVANGSVELRRGDASEVVVTAEIKAMTQERLDATRLVVSRSPDTTLHIGVAWPDNKRLNNEGCSLVITMPDAGSVVLTSSNGALSVVGVGTDLKLRTSNGRITAERIPGSVVARTSNGRVTLTDIGGKVDVDTSNGRLELTGLAGPVEARTSNGRIHIELVDDAIGPVTVHSSNGAAVIAVGDAFAGRLRLNTSNGSVSIDGPVSAQSVELRKSSGTLVFPGDGSSSVTTSNGSITVRKAEG